MDQVLDPVPCKVTPVMNDRLNVDYRVEEVKMTLFQMILTKAPGPDGFPAHFFQRHRKVCGQKITNASMRLS